jgi:hypothetical protein
MAAGGAYKDALEAARSRMRDAEDAYIQARLNYRADVKTAMAAYLPTLTFLDCRAREVEAQVQELQAEADSRARDAEAAAAAAADAVSGPRDFVAYSGTIHVKAGGTHRPVVHAHGCYKTAKADFLQYPGGDGLGENRWYRLRAVTVWDLIDEGFPVRWWTTQERDPARMCGYCRPEKTLVPDLTTYAGADTTRAFLDWLERTESAPPLPVTPEAVKKAWRAVSDTPVVAAWPHNQTPANVRPGDPHAVLLQTRPDTGPDMTDRFAAKGLHLSPIPKPGIESGPGELWAVRYMTAWEKRVHKGHIIKLGTKDSNSE